MTARDANIKGLDQHNANNYTTSRRHDNDLIDFQVQLHNTIVAGAPSKQKGGNMMVKTNKNKADFATQDTSEYATPTIQDRSRMKMTANTSLARDDTTNDASIME